MIIKLLVEGGEMKPGPTVGQQLGPIGVNIGEVINQVNKATSEFKGMKVPVVLNIDSKTKKINVEVSSPPASELLKKEVGVEKGSGDHKKNTIGNASIEQVIKVAKIKFPNMLAKEFKSAVKSIVGSCTSLGILTENKEAKYLMEDIDSGIFDKEIKEQKTETSAEKKEKLKQFLDEIIKKQESIKKAEELAKAEAEAAKAKTGEVKEGEAKAAEGEESKETATPKEEVKESVKTSKTKEEKKK